MIKRFYFSVTGRISRQFYWLFGILPFAILGFVLGGWLALYPLTTNAAITVILLFTASAMWPTLAMQIKRWHDIGQSGWLCLLSLIPYVGIVVWIVVGCIPGTKGENRFGPDPLAADK